MYILENKPNTYSFQEQNLKEELENGIYSVFQTILLET